MLLRRCAVCGGEIRVDLPYKPSYVYYRKKWYCSECFAATTTPRVLNSNWFAKTRTFVLQEVSKDNLYHYFINHYNLSSIPPFIFKRLDAIYNGTYKGLAQPIPPNELLDIIQRKEDYIDRCLARKNIVGTPSISYALTVACGEYKSYKEWQSSLKAQQEQAKQEAQDRQGYSYTLKGYSVQPSADNNFIDLDEEE